MTTARTRHHRRALGAAALLAGLALPAAAQAQTAAGWALDRYDPAAAGDVFFAAAFPWYNAHGSDVALRGGFTFDYASNPLVLRTEGNGAPQVNRIVADMAVLHAQIGVAFANRFNVNLSLPVGLYQNGERSIGGLAASRTAGIGDLRIGGRVRLLGDADRDAVSLHGDASLYFNSALLGVSRATNLTDDGFRGRLGLTLAGRGGPVRWSVSAGFHLRQTSVEVAGTRIGNDLFATAGLGFVGLDDRLTIGPELWFSTVLTSAFEERHTNLEGTLGASYLIGDLIQVGVAAGPGFTYGAGTPAWRGLVRVAYAPPDRAPPPAPDPDTDQDGVLDRDDQCPTVPQGANPDPARRGCPLMDTDLDGVFDHEDQCVTTPQGANPDPARRGCPRGDRDGDTVFDDEDQCVDVPMGANPDPTRRGCPARDDDCDGVFNHEDQCRHEARGDHPDPARAGCPVPDRDRDSVPDSADHCPDEVGAPSTNPALNGCPGSLGARMQNSVLTFPPEHQVHFESDRDRIDAAASQAVLARILDVLRATENVQRARVEGHTDEVGDDAYNLDLSQRRAGRVRDWLAAHGIAADHLDARGYGETRLIRSAVGARGSAITHIHAANRRVEVVIEIAPPPAPTPVTPDPTPAVPCEVVPESAAH